MGSEWLSPFSTHFSPFSTHFSPFSAHSSPLSPKGQGQTTAIYCKNGEFHSDPVCTDPVQNFPVHSGWPRNQAGTGTGTDGTVFPEPESGTVFQEPKPEPSFPVKVYWNTEEKKHFAEEPPEPKIGTARTVPCRNRTTELKRTGATLYVFWVPKGAGKASCGETVVQKRVFVEPVSSLLP